MEWILAVVAKQTSLNRKRKRKHRDWKGRMRSMRGKSERATTGTGDRNMGDQEERQEWNLTSEGREAKCILTLAQKGTNRRFQVENTQHLCALHCFSHSCRSNSKYGRRCLSGAVLYLAWCLLSTALPYPPTERKTLGVLCLPSSSESERLQWNDRACWEESDKLTHYRGPAQQSMSGMCL